MTPLPRDSADEVSIDSDETGFTIALSGDFARTCATYLAADGHELRLRLPQDAALQLLAQVRAEIGPWAEGYERELAAYQRATPAERAAVLRGPSPGAVFVDESDRDGWRAEIDFDGLREAVDLSRKAARESA